MSDSASVISTSSSASSSSSPTTIPPLLTAPEHLVGPRPNEHLAVLMPKHLWKSDSLAAECDSFYCHTRFTILERRHHCRKCGGIFCKTCSSRKTPLLDTSNLSFFHPPRNTPVSQFASPTSPVVDSRVCDDCWDQLHGCPSTPRTPELTSVLPINVGSRSRPLSPASSSPSSSSPNTPPNGLGLVVSAHIESRASSSKDTASLQRSLSRSSGKRASNPDLRRRVTVLRGHATLPHTTFSIPLPEEEERSYGELDSYPLRRSSALCKASGGGRWEPKQCPVMDGYRVPVPGGKAPFELEMEREMEEERRRRENPVIRDGEFQYRLSRQGHNPELVDSKPQRSYSLSTF
ncbi:hypothetical protein VKT23_002906 [Stygiomarasmius scandens]|uniref:FYVE-type domain-containing protein n=1 Tax=Marasmiellus scandens TaxID=2682957 RepID=A0ABR1JWB0_9AGAR